ncbi:MAG: plastocyanin/azurin family copper-binding protein [Fidelibacterota bacterium]
MKEFEISIIAVFLLVVPLTSSAKIVNVSISGFAFNPPTVAVKEGDTVRWTNQDAAPHTSTSDSGIWDSGTLNQGESFSFQFNTSGTYTYYCTIHPTMKGTVVVETSTTIKDEKDALSLSQSYYLDQNYPNPFNSATVIPYFIGTSEAVHVKLKIYNLLGQVVVELVNGEKSPGTYSVNWNGRDSKGKKVKGGIYFYQLESIKFKYTKAMLYLK